MSLITRTVFPKDVPVISLEAASKEGWPKYSHYQLGLDYFGKSAPMEDLYEHFGFTGPKVAAKAKGLIAHFEGKTVPFLMDLPQLD
jgi:transketolase